MSYGRRYQPKAQPSAPELVRAANPYKNIPSLYDMYVQAIPRPVTPKRFGAEVFENGTRDTQFIPMDVPAGPDYVVGPGDGLSISLWGGVSQRIYRVVDREGRVSLPEVGPVLVSGKSMGQVQEYLQQTLRTQFRAVSADVSLTRLRTFDATGYDDRVAALALLRCTLEVAPHAGRIEHDDGNARVEHLFGDRLGECGLARAANAKHCVGLYRVVLVADLYGTDLDSGRHYFTHTLTVIETPST